MLGNQFKKFKVTKKPEEEKPVIFYSNASWTKIPDSQDRHDSECYATT